MQKEILNTITQFGLMPGLFVYLLWYILKEQKERDIRQENREIKYQTIISDLTHKFNLVEEIKKDVEDIKEVIKEKVGVK